MKVVYNRFKHEIEAERIATMKRAAKETALSVLILLATAFLAFVMIAQPM